MHQLALVVNSCSDLNFEQEGEAADETDLRIIVWFRRILGLRGSVHDRVPSVYNDCGFWFDLRGCLTF